MKEKKESKRTTPVPSYETIIKATCGDEAAIASVLQFFDPAISSKAMRPYIDEQEKCSYYVDPFISGHIRGGLIEAILDFRKYINE